MESRIRLR